MSGTKRAWQDVAKILNEAGWPATSGQAPPEEVLTFLPPLREDTGFYRWLPSGAIMALIGCLIALSFGALVRQQNPDMSRANEQLATLRERVDSLQNWQTKNESTLRDADRLSKAATEKAELASTAVSLVQESVTTLQRNVEHEKEELRAVSKALSVLKDDMRSQLSAFDERLKREHNQQINAIEDIKKLLKRRADKQGPSDIKELIVGRWVLLTIERESGKNPFVRDGAFEFKADGKFVVLRENRTLGEGSYTIDAGEFPTAISIKWTKTDGLKELSGYIASEELGLSPDGIAEIGCRDLMKIALAPSGNRPKDFSVRARPRVVLLIFHKTE